MSAKNQKMTKAEFRDILRFWLIRKFPNRKYPFIVVGRTIGISPNTIRALYYGNRMPMKKTIMKLAGFFNVSPQSFLKKKHPDLKEDIWEIKKLVCQSCEAANSHCSFCRLGEFFNMIMFIQDGFSLEESLKKAEFISYMALVNMNARSDKGTGYKE